MPTLGVSHPFPPTWIDEFRQAMAWSDRDQRWSDADVLDLIGAAADLDAWLHDPRPYAWRHKHAWESAIADLHAAADLIGPRLAAALGHHLTAALAATSALPGDNPTPDRPAAQAALAALRTRWADPTVVEAAWLDIADACRDSGTPFETIAARRDIFWQLIRSADRNAHELGGALAGVLGDQAMNVMAARVALGDTPNPGPAGRPELSELGGLSEADRMDLGRRVLAAPNTSAHHVVWVAFDRASLVGTVETVGRITFYAGRWVRESLERKGPHLSQLPSELTNRESLVSHQDLPDGSHVVLARVDLGTGAFPDAPRVAAEQARAIVAVASFHAGDRHWQALDGYLHAVDGLVVGWSLFHDPLTEISDIRADLHLTGGELARLAGTLGSQLPVTSSALTEAIEALHWWQDTQDRPPLAAVGLDVRVVELVASRVLATAPAKRRTWHHYLDDYLAIAWMLEHVRDELHRVVFHALHNYERQNVDPKDHSALAALQAAVVTYGAGRRYEFHLDQALAALSTLVTIYPVHDRLGRRIHTLATHLASPPALDAWCDILQHRWDRTLARLRRTRDAITHGGPITADAISTVHRFGRRMAGWALSLSLEGLLDGTGGVARHITLRGQDQAWRAGVPTAASVNDALFPP
jgi:hypothetical protein